MGFFSKLKQNYSDNNLMMEINDYVNNYSTNMRENTPMQYAQKYGRFCSFKQRGKST